MKDRDKLERLLATRSLTAEQVESLAEGTPILVIWSGGNGPHRYVVHVDQRGQRYAAQRGASPQMLTYNPLDFVGQERYHTRVWLTTRNTTTAEAQAEYDAARQALAEAQPK